MIIINQVNSLTKTPPTILEGNEIIPKGMGMKFNNGNLFPFIKSSVLYNDYYQEPKFFSDYNWIMNAIEFIEKTNKNILIEIVDKTTTISEIHEDFNNYNTIIDCTALTKHESIWLAVSEYFNLKSKTNIN